LEPSREFWFNLKTKEVESGPQSLSMDRVGPFASFEEAAKAPQIIADRARRIREEADREDSWD
jgi:hypothetical protein